MDKLKDMLGKDGCRGIVRSSEGETAIFRNRGVADLYRMITDNPKFINGATVADKVIGRGAALLLVKGNATEIYAEVISYGALDILQKAGIRVSYGKKTAHIINRTGTGPCPVEQLTAATDSPDEAYRLIRTFIRSLKKGNVSKAPCGAP